MRNYMLCIAFLSLAVMILAGQWVYVLYIVATTGSYLLTEPKTLIITSELIIAALISLGATIYLISGLRRSRDD